MSDAIDLRAPVLRYLELVEIEALSGTYRFIVCATADWTDANGNRWVGHEGIRLSALGEPINGVAPAGSLTLEYFQDPEKPDLFAELQASGDANIDGRALRLYSYFWEREQELYAPTRAPTLEYTFVMRSLTFTVGVGFERALTVHFESVNEWRAVSRAIAMDTAGHALLLDGQANPSLKFAPRRAGVLWEALF